MKISLKLRGFPQLRKYKFIHTLSECTNTHALSHDQRSWIMLHLTSSLSQEDLYTELRACSN